MYREDDSHVKIELKLMLYKYLYYFPGNEIENYVDFYFAFSFLFFLTTV
jgi:hypothetical protein